jgi:hypothetical protein
LRSRPTLSFYPDLQVNRKNNGRNKEQSGIDRLQTIIKVNRRLSAMKESIVSRVKQSEGAKRQPSKSLRLHVL